jgi:hypothetical protein
LGNGLRLGCSQNNGPLKHPANGAHYLELEGSLFSKYPSPRPLPYSKKPKRIRKRRTHTYINTYIYAYIYTCIHAYIHTYIHTGKNIYPTEKTQKNKKKKNIYVYTCMHTYVHIYIYIYMNTYIHTYIHTYWQQTNRQTS